jgi:diguanylate cyclase (GGDEF)-like protein
VKAEGSRPTARQAALLFVAAGLVTLFGAPIVAGGSDEIGMLLILVVAAFGAVGLAWRLPWERWPIPALLALPATALVLVGAGHALDEGSLLTSGAFFVVLFAWVGLALRIAAAMRELRSARALDARRVGDLEAIVAATGLLQGDIDPGELGDLLARVATSVLHGAGAIVLFQDDERGLQPVASYQEELRPVPLAAEAMAGGQPVAVAGLLVAPLRGHHSVLGAVAISYAADAVPDAFTVHAAQLFGSQAGLAVEQLRVKEALTTAAMEDALTGVGNRRRAAALLEGLRPGDAVVLIDLDHFKLVNDTAGHAAGDRVLVLLGRYLREAARGADTVARYGGEEFLLVLRSVAGSALAATQRLTQGWRDMQPLTTFSAGVAVHVDGRSPAATLGRADAALYRAKRTGRDRVCEDGEEAVETADSP